MKYHLILLPILLLICGIASAETLQTTVTYVAASVVYIDAGFEKGVQKGDSGKILHKGKSVAQLRVEFVAEKSASCAIQNPSGTIEVGDAVTLSITKRPEATVDTVSKTHVEVAAPPVITPPKKPQTGARVSGSVALQLIGQTSRDVFDYGYYEPGLALRARVDHFMGNGPVLNVRMNLRRSYHNVARPDVPRREWLSRVYEVSLSFDTPESRINYSVGRLLSNHLAGIGYIDGALFGYQVAPRVEIGAFGGTQPDLRTTDVRPNATKAGVYAAYEQQAAAGRSLNASVAAAGEYYRGQISREFLYEQANYYSSGRFSAYQSAEINLNRGWRKKAGTSTLELTNLLLSARYSVLKSVTLSASYDHRTPYRTYETRSIVDSLFDTSLLQGYRAGLEWRLPLSVQADVQGGLSTRRSERSSMRTLTGGLSTRNFLGTHTFLGGRVTTFTNPSSSGYQPVVTVSRLLFDRVTAGVQAGTDTYTLKSAHQTVHSNWQRASLDWMMTRLLYGSASYELYRGDGFKADRYLMEIGCRF